MTAESVEIASAMDYCESQTELNGKFARNSFRCKAWNVLGDGTQRRGW